MYVMHLERVLKSVETCARFVLPCPPRTPGEWHTRPLLGLGGGEVSASDGLAAKRGARGPPAPARHIRLGLAVQQSDSEF